MNIDFDIPNDITDQNISDLFNEMCQIDIEEDNKHKVNDNKHNVNDNEIIKDKHKVNDNEIIKEISKDNEFEKLYNLMTNKNENLNDDDLNLFKCNDCGSDEIYYDNGANYCGKCGVQLGQLINNEYLNCNEKNIFDRFSVPISNHMPQSSLGTSISLTRYYDFYKLRKYHTWNQMPYKERSLYKSFQIIMSGASKENIPTSITELAKTYYKNFSNLKITRGVNRSAVIAACIYYACKENNVPRSSKEIANMFNLNICDMTKGCKIYISVMKKSENTTYINSNNPLHYIKRFCSKLNIDQNTNNLAEYVALKSLYLKIVKENTPASIASGSIYFVGFTILGKDKASKFKKQISHECKISEVTISKCFKKMYNPDIRLQLFPPSIRDKMKFNH